MSYIRADWPLKYFKGCSKEYVVLSSNSKGKDFIKDYNSNYVDDTTFIELLGTYIYLATKDKKYSEKIIRILAKKLKCKNKLRARKLTDKQIFDIMVKKIKQQQLKQLLMK